jgi:hypothetical protein
MVQEKGGMTQPNNNLEQVNPAHKKTFSKNLFKENHYTPMKELDEHYLNTPTQKKLDILVLPHFASKHQNNQNYPSEHH